MVSCEKCSSDDIELVEKLDDGRRRLACSLCGHQWLRGERQHVHRPPAVPDLRKNFAALGQIDPDRAARVERLGVEFLRDHPQPDPRAVEFRARYREIFSRDGLPDASPEDFRAFANANLAGNPGNMSIFNTAWNDLGPEAAAERVRDALSYLLYGPDDTYIEDRLTHLIEARNGMGMTGFREALLTKTLCMVEPERFLPINKYTGQAGKREIAEWVFGVNLPRPESVNWTIGRLIFWSNDLLRDLAGPGFVDNEHVAGFLWWAKGEGSGQPAAEGIEEDDDGVAVFQDDDSGFRGWLREHPAGRYINVPRSRGSEEAVLHRVDCIHVGDAPREEKSWTHHYIKVCSAENIELEAWARTATSCDVRRCQTCDP